MSKNKKIKLYKKYIIIYIMKNYYNKYNKYKYKYLFGG